MIKSLIHMPRQERYKSLGICVNTEICLDFLMNLHLIYTFKIETELKAVLAGCECEDYWKVSIIVDAFLVEMKKLHAPPGRKNAKPNYKI